jgi:hypothetical protein
MTAHDTAQHLFGLAPKAFLWLSSAPAPLLEAAARALDSAERLLGLAETGSTSAPEGATWWFVLTDQRAGLLAVAPTMTRWQPISAPLRCERSRLGRDDFSQGDAPLFVGPRLGGAELRGLVELSAHPPFARLALAAEAHREESPAAALALGEAALRASDPLDLQGQARVWFGLAQIHHAQARPDAARAALEEAARLASREDLLAASQRLGLKEQRWYVLLACAQGNASAHDAAAATWAHIAAQHPKEPIFHLERARALARAERHDGALAAYDDFLRAQPTRAELSLLPSDADDPGLLGSDPERAAAWRESGGLCRALERHGDATARFLDLVREAPWSMEAHRLLFRAAEHLPEPPPQARRAAQILRLTHPAVAEALAQELGPLPAPPTPAALPTRYAPLSQQELEEASHPQGRDKSAIMQRWLGKMTYTQRDITEIKRHCQRLEEKDWPEHRRALGEVAGLLGMATPTCYISRGATGIEAHRDGADFALLLGAEHLSTDSARHLGLAHFCFAVATQLTHVRAGHLVLTRQEFWTNLANASWEALSVLLNFLPLGPLTEKATSVLLAKVEAKALRALIEAAGKHAPGATRRVLTEVLKPPAPVSRDTLMREHLTSFAHGERYSADRIGLLACDDLEAAVEAIFRLHAVEELPTARAHGLAAALARQGADGQPRYRELALRLGEIFKFALSDEYEALRARHLPQRSPLEDNARYTAPANDTTEGTT